ncbi:MAG TPA: universal stress protein [Methylomirabilota bacterium]|nr:universal stress protein [Methylomirabilota bacterium]
MTVTSEDRLRTGEATRVLLGVHGGEPAGWELEARRAIAMWGAPCVRILAVVDVPRPPFASLLPAAARRYHAAREAWHRAEQRRLQGLIDDLAPLLPGGCDLAWTTATRSDPGRAIAEYAAAWGADVVLVGAAPAPGPWLGAVHERVIRHARCAVLVTPVSLAPRRRARVPAPARVLGRARRAVVAGQGV